MIDKKNERFLELKPYKIEGYDDLEFIPALVDYDSPDDDGTVGLGLISSISKGERVKAVAFWPDGRTSDSRFKLLLNN